MKNQKGMDFNIHAFLYIGNQNTGDFVIIKLFFELLVII